ncbi:MAG: methylated-DNA--[protein]-cysteine S-methyltransferase [Nitrospinota bacterium]
MKTYSRIPLDIPITYTVFKNPIGYTGLVASPKGLLRLVNKVTNERSLENYLSRLTSAEISKNNSGFKDLIKQFSRYFEGKLKHFEYPLDFQLGTPFQQKVWKKLITIPYGTTRSYKWLASAIKNPNATRAVGNANGKNPLSIIIPCHRVIRESGNLGGYTGGLNIKRFLLKLEQEK